MTAESISLSATDFATTIFFTDAVKSFELAICERNEKLKSLNKSVDLSVVYEKLYGSQKSSEEDEPMPVWPSTSDQKSPSYAEGKTAIVRAVAARTFAIGESRFPLSSDASSVMGHIPVGYARNDIGGTYTHPVFMNPMTTEHSGETNNKNVLIFSTAKDEAPLISGLYRYALSTVAFRKVETKGRTVLEIIPIGGSYFDKDGKTTLQTASSFSGCTAVAAFLHGGARSAVVTPAVYPFPSTSSDSNLLLTAAAEAHTIAKENAEANVWGRAREAEANEIARRASEKTTLETQTEESNEQKEGNDEEKESISAAVVPTISEVGTRPTTSTFFVHSTATSGSPTPLTLGSPKDIKATLNQYVNSMGFDVILAVLPHDEINIEPLLKTIAALISKDRSASAYVFFSSSTKAARPQQEKEKKEEAKKATTPPIETQLDALAASYGIDFVLIDQSADATGDKTNAEEKEEQTLFNCYKLFPRHDEAGLPLDPFQKYDVIVQGTGMTESFLSAALARAGRKVLHLDASANYGGPAFASVDLGTFHRQYCLPLRPDGTFGDGHKHFYGSPISENCYYSVKTSLKINKIFNGVSNLADNNASEKTNGNLLSDREVRQTIIDAVPLFSFARGPLINTLVDGRAGRNLEFMTVDRVVLLDPTNSTPPSPYATAEATSPTPTPAPASTSGASSSLAARRALLAAKKMAKDTASGLATAVSAAANKAATTLSATPSQSSTDAFTPRLVPFSRADVFKGGNNLFSNPLEARRAMKFFKDLEKSYEHTAEDSGNENELDKRVEMAKEKEKDSSGAAEQSSPCVEKSKHQQHRILCADGETFRRALPWEEPSQDPYEPLESFLARHYGLSSATIDLLTMGGALVPSSSKHNHTSTYTLASAVNLIRTSLASVGRFGVGDTPFLCPMYGSGEIPQNMCRISAVWDATFILRRCVETVLPQDVTPEAGAGTADGANEERKNNSMLRVRLSNGQVVETRALVMPKELETSNATTSANTSSGLLRAVMVLSRPLLSWAQLEQRCNDHPPQDDSEELAHQLELRAANKFPILLGVLKAEKTPRQTQPQTSVPSETAPIVVHQVGASTGHAPQTVNSLRVKECEGCCSDPRLTILHFSADAGAISRETFEATIEGLLRGEKETEKKTELDLTTNCTSNTGCGTDEEKASCALDVNAEGCREKTSEQSVTKKEKDTETSLFIPRSAVLYFATFVLTSEEVASHSAGGALHRAQRTTSPASSLSASQSQINGQKATIFHTSSLIVPSSSSASSLNTALGETVNASGDATESNEMKALTASGLPSILNDSSYVCEAVELYKNIMEKLIGERVNKKEKKVDTLPATSSDTAAANAKKLTQPNSRKIKSRSQRRFMPFLYKLPDPTGRGVRSHQQETENESSGSNSSECSHFSSEDDEAHDTNGEDDDEDAYDTHASYAKRLLEGVSQ